MLDFTAALYLGFRHPLRALRPWSQLTPGAPAALGEGPKAAALAAHLARLLGCERAVLARSTLHLSWDLFGVLAQEGVAFLPDEGAYPVLRWGVERAAGRGVPVYPFPHGDVAALQRLVSRRANGLRPVVVCDGVCHCCGCTAPLVAYAACVRRAGGLLVVDDTQAVGLLGHSPSPAAPYGQGGGGSLSWSGVNGPDLLVISSLAKSFGAPVAVLAGSNAWVQRFTRQSETRVYCSPPSAADLHAAEHALRLNAQQGDSLRRHLAQRVRYFQQRLADQGLAATGGLFPVQTLQLDERQEPQQVYGQLLQAGLRTILRQSGVDGRPRISLIITARHTPPQLAQAAATLAQVLQATPQPQGEHG